MSRSHLRNELLKRYGFPESIRCEFLLQGVNDTYLVINETKKYVFRLYRFARKSFDNVLEEVALVGHLQKRTNLVAALVEDLQQNIIQSFETPEGERYGLLMECAANTELENHCIISNECTSYGESVGKLHRHLETFEYNKKRTLIDFDHLVAQPLELVKHQFPKMNLSVLLNIAQSLINGLSQHSGNLIKSYIHGDLTGGNACLSEEKEYIFFDFDCCGYGWRAYDLAVFYWSTHTCGKPALWENFLKGYSSHISLNDTELQAIPLLAMLRQVWIIGYSIQQIERKGAFFYKPKDLQGDIEYLISLSESTQLPPSSKK